MLFDQFKANDQPLKMAVYQDLVHSDTPIDLASHQQLLEPFAIDDAILNAINQGTFNTPLALHFWPTQPTIILGGMDTRLPNLTNALTWLHQDLGLTPVVRPAGGLAVVSDPKVLNFTLVLNTENNHLAIDDAYQLIVDLLQKMMDNHQLSLEVGEVETSYCPGKFDVSINGKKIAGIAQRRIGHAVGIYIYISISGDQAKRGEMIKAMYDHGEASQDEKKRYPQVDPDSMRNLSDFSNINTVTAFTHELLDVIKGLGVELELHDQNELEIENYMERMVKRNQVVYDTLSDELT